MALLCFIFVHSVREADTPRLSVCCFAACPASASTVCYSCFTDTCLSTPPSSPLTYIIRMDSWTQSRKKRLSHYSQTPQLACKHALCAADTQHQLHVCPHFISHTPICSALRICCCVTASAAVASSLAIAAHCVRRNSAIDCQCSRPRTCHKLSPAALAAFIQPASPLGSSALSSSRASSSAQERVSTRSTSRMYRFLSTALFSLEPFKHRN